MTKIVAALLLLISVLHQLILAADPAETPPAKNPIETQLTKIEHEWADAYLKRNPSFVKRLTTENFVFIGPDGKAMNKEEYVKEITGDTTFSAFTVSDLKIRTYGNVGLVTGIAHITAKTRDHDETGDYAFTDVFVKQGGEWKAVSGQATALKPVEPPR